MKILKKSLWNHIFHKKQLQRQLQEELRLRHIIATADDFLQQLKICSDLQVMLNLHKDMWGAGIRNRNLGPCQQGMFRTRDILTMKPEEVFLGNICGLSTFTIPTWEQQRENRYGKGAAKWGLNPDVTLYEIVCKQYHDHLVTNVEAIRKEAEASLAQY